MKTKINNKTKKLAMLLVSGTIMISGFTPAFANSNVDINSDTLTLSKSGQDVVIYGSDTVIVGNSEKDIVNFDNIEDIKMPSFSEFIKDMPDDIKKDIKNEDMKKLESLYNKAIKLEEKQNYDESDKLWDEFDQLLGMGFQMPTFSEFIKDMPDDMKKDIKNDDMKKLESLYNKAIKLEEKQNYDESDKLWDEFDQLLGMNFQMPTFSEFIKEFPDDMKKDIKNDDMKNLESLYNKAVKLDEKENYDESNKLWDEFDQLLGMDFEEEDE